MRYFTYIFCCLLFSFNLQAEVPSLDSLFHSSNYTETVKVLEEGLSKGADANLYYNLALSYYKLGNKAEAILAIERSYYLDPCNSETREVMAMLYKSTEGVNQYERGVLTSLGDRFAYMLSMTAWIVWALLLFACGMLALVYYFYSTNALHQRIAFYIFIAFVLLSFVANGAIAHQYYYHKQVEDLAIVKDKANIYAEPDKELEPMTEVFVGNRLILLDNDEGISSSWQAVLLPNDKEGYIEKSAITNVIEAIN